MILSPALNQPEVIPWPISSSVTSNQHQFTTSSRSFFSSSTYQQFNSVITIQQQQSQSSSKLQLMNSTPTSSWMRCFKRLERPAPFQLVNSEALMQSSKRHGQRPGICGAMRRIFRKKCGKNRQSDGADAGYLMIDQFGSRKFWTLCTWSGTKDKFDLHNYPAIVSLIEVAIRYSTPLGLSKNIDDG